METNLGAANTSDTLEIDGRTLTIESFIAVIRDKKKVVLSSSTRDKIIAIRKTIDEKWLVQEGDPIYGFNTGIGSLKSEQVSIDQLLEFQKLYIKSHSVGVGDLYSAEITRGALLLRINSFAKGNSGVTIELMDKLIELLNNDIIPAIPQKGSLGASGDLAPLAHLASIVIGEPKAKVILPDGKTCSLSTLSNNVKKYVIGGTTYHQVTSFKYNKVLFETIDLQPKEALALTNGVTFTQAMATTLHYDCEYLLKMADLASALSLEAILGENAAFDHRISEVRGFPGQIRTAENIRNAIYGSKRTTQKARTAFDALNGINYGNRVQDRYSFRCVPQVHGASKEAFTYFSKAVGYELNAATDNPLIFETKDGVGLVALSGGNFHGQPLAIPLDTLSVAISEIGNISDRRIFALLNKSLSYGLPNNLSGSGQIGSGKNTGLMITQYTTASLVSENKSLCFPSSADSIPSSGNQEDHVSMGSISARKAMQIYENTCFVLTLEILCAIQAIKISTGILSREEYPMGDITERVFEELDGMIPFIKEDIFLKPVIDLVHETIWGKRTFEKYLKDFKC